MKKLIGITALAAFSLSLFSFSTAKAKKANYNEVKSVNFITMRAVGSFSQYQSNQYTSGQGTWNYRVQTWSLSEGDASLDQVAKALND
jgi:hypothetical protein